ncbi:NERD domain-containing protein [Halobacillus locisalis]|uniref:NERD domain-containing protein n=1 Tax=Halobacillus locisalis TaxID=220753 RepID=A0A838CMQ8_9BACI|nr:NERD domain-containing protein [Halobacillus locisalis]MBA2173284.1 NERD domain-containing protein [Halobacillus locisalis]
MAQLIKLQDYISRYESNIYQYPSKYIRLKQEHWKKMKSLFDQGLLEQSSTEEAPEEEGHLYKKSGWKRLFRTHSDDAQPQPPVSRKDNVQLPKTIDQLKKYFLDGLFPFQLKWASTTLREKSFVHQSYKEDERLKFYLQRFPDTYFLMYRPVVVMKRAEMEALPILIGPYGIEIIYEMDLPGADEVEPTSEKSWYMEKDGVRTKMLSPVLALNRTETFIKSVWNAYGLSFPVQKVVLAPNLSFKHRQEPYMTTFVDRERYDTWLQERRQYVSPLKHEQLKAAEALLKHCQTTSFKRPEWDSDEEFMED